LVKEWERDYRKQLTIALLSKGSVKENLKISEEYGATHLLVQGESTISDAYQVKWTPAGVLISAQARIAGHLSYGVDAIKELVIDAVATTVSRAIGNNGGSTKRKTIQIAEESSYNIGDFAPEFTVADVEGRIVKSSDFRGQDTALLFWNPGCPFCQQMSDDLISWEENPPKHAPHLVIVAAGDADRIEADSKRFTSRYVRDLKSEIGLSFGTNVTPSAVIIGRDGRIASTIAAGPDTLVLLGARKATLPVVSAS
jgi:peroxiredoxin